MRPSGWSKPDGSRENNVTLTKQLTDAGDSPAARRPLDTQALRAEFPIFREPRDRPPIYLHSAATSQKPEPVLAAMDHYYRSYNAKIHRGIYAIAAQATAA